MRHGDYIASIGGHGERPDDHLENGGLKKTTLQMIANEMIKRGRKLEHQSKNPRIPAGYTYFAQLIAHDLVFHDLSSTLFSTDNRTPGSSRTPQLDLDCIYGGGPLQVPALYAVEPDQSLPRRRLRLSQVCDSDQERKLGRGCLGALRDLPRILCPAMELGAPQGAQNRTPLYDTLIADPRNEDNLILSQIVILFYRFHNFLIDYLDGIGWPKHAANDVDRHKQQFTTARNFVRHAYRHIIFNDFLQRFLDPSVYDAYSDPSFSSFKYKLQKNGTEIPSEFWLGAFRAGHLMVRNAYDFGPSHDEEVSIAFLLNFTGGFGAGRVPITKDWVIEDWRLFFDAEPEDGQGLLPAVNQSRKIKPTPAPRLTHGFTSADGGVGLHYRDLMRAWAEDLPSGQALACELGLKKDVIKAEAIVKWLPEVLPEDDKNRVLAETPLFFYVLCEADEQADGNHLGKLGSTIVADVLFGLDRSGARSVSTSAFNRVFPFEVPNSMPQLVALVERGS